MDNTVYENPLITRYASREMSENFSDLKRAIRQWLVSGKSREEVRYDCYDVINCRWNSGSQIRIIKSVIG